jgi:hypothetical protein
VKASNGKSKESFFSTQYDTNSKWLNTIRKTEDLNSLFTEDQLSGLTLEQKLLAGLFIPNKKIDKNVIDLL